MNFRVTAALLIALGALAGYFYYFEVVVKEEKQAAEKAEKKLFQVEQRADVGSIRIERSGEQPLQLVRGESNFTITEPIATGSSVRDVNMLLDAIIEADLDRYLDNPKEPSVYELDPPKMVVTVKGTDGSAKGLYKVGGPNPGNAKIYGQRNDETGIFLVEKHKADQLDKSLLNLRDRHLLRFNWQAATTLKLEYPDGGGIDLKRLDSGEWEFLSPIEGLADRMEVEKILRQVSDLESESFVVEDITDDSRSQYGFAPALIKVTAEVPGSGEGAEPVRHVFEAGSLDDAKASYHVIGSRQPSKVGMVTKTKVEAINLDLNTLRDRQLFYFLEEDVRGVKLTNAYGEVAFNRNDGGVWTFQLNGEDLVGDINVCPELINAVRRNKAERVIDTPESGVDYGLEKPRITAEYTLKSGENLTVKFGNNTTRGNQVYATNSSKKGIFVLPEIIMQSFDRKLSDFRDKKLFHFQPHDARRVEFISPSGTIVFVGSQRDGWKVEGREDVKVVSVNVDTFLFNWSNANFADVVEEKADEAALKLHGLSPAAFMLRVFTSSMEEPSSELLLGTELAEEDKVMATNQWRKLVTKVDRKYVRDFPRDLEQFLDKPTPVPEDEE